ncbi:MAG: PBSX family phage terminase large subunit, partial [Oscillospiraceae bacterium]|nr:PBSX family phage terminase large subunit [Oscillospiraceae bacterium]
LERYKKLYSGAFYTRFVEGKWAAADGLVYPMFSPQAHVCRQLPEAFDETCVSCDYGTVNPSSFGLWGRSGTAWIRLREYYWDSRERGQQRTDEEHYRALEELVAAEKPSAVICDPSAASFLECIRRHGRFAVIPAKNDVLDGIRRVADALREGKLLFAPECRDTLREFGLYRWQEGGGKDAPRKEYDHAMDDIRYFAATMLYNDAQGGFFAASVERNGRYPPENPGGFRPDA